MYLMDIFTQYELPPSLFPGSVILTPSYYPENPEPVTWTAGAPVWLLDRLQNFRLFVSFGYSPGSPTPLYSASIGVKVLKDNKIMALWRC